MAGDFDELMELSRDLTAAGSNVASFARKAVEVTARHVKDDAQKTVRQRKGLGHAAAAIDYEIKGRTDGVDAEVGYDKDKAAGPLGNLIEYGAPNAKAHMLVTGRDGKLVNIPVPGARAKPLPPSHDLANALLNNEDDFERGLDIAVDDALKELGL